MGSRPQDVEAPTRRPAVWPPQIGCNKGNGGQNFIPSGEAVLGPLHLCEFKEPALHSIHASHMSIAIHTQRYLDIEQLQLTPHGVCATRCGLYPTDHRYRVVRRCRSALIISELSVASPPFPPPAPGSLPPTQYSRPPTAYRAVDSGTISASRLSKLGKSAG